MDNVPNCSSSWYYCQSKAVCTSGGGGGSTSTATDAFGRLRVSNPITLFDSQNRYSISTKFYSNIIDGASVTYSNTEATVNLNVTTAENAYAGRESKFVFNYQPGKSLLVLNSFVMNSPKSNLVQRVGYFGSDNGYYIQLEDSTVSLVQRSNSTGVLTNTVVPQSQWNGDRLNGTGPSRITLNVSASQLLFTDVEWLGVGSVRMGLIIDGNFITCHTFHHSNITPITYMTTACLPVRYEIFTKGITSSNSTLKQICSTVMSEGGYEPREQLFCAIGPYTGKTLSATGTLIPLVTIRLAPGRLDAIALIKQINIAVETNNDLVQWQLILNATLTGATYVGDTGGSTNVQIDTAATAVSGGRVIEVGYAQTGSINTSLQDSFFEAHIGRNSFTQTSDTISLCVIPISVNPKCFWSFAWSELL